MQPKQPPIYLPELADVIDRYPLTVSPQTPLSEVIALMGQMRNSCPIAGVLPAPEMGNIPTSPLLGEARASCVLIVDTKPSASHKNSFLQGIFTERDLVGLIASGDNLKNLSIASVMTQPVMLATESEAQDVFTVLILLRQHRIRHLPIIGDRGEILGIITPESIRQAMLQPANLLKMRRVEEVMTSEVIQAPETASVLSIAQLMTTHRVSCVVITKDRERLEKSESGKVQKGESGSRGEGESGSRGEGESGRVQEGESGRVQEGESGSRGAGESGSRGEGESGSRGEGESGSRGEGKSGRVQEGESGSRGAGESGRVQEGEKQNASFPPSPLIPIPPDPHPRIPIPIGMVTERDIVQFQALELDLSRIQAKTVMSTPLFCLKPEDSLWVAHQEMQQRYVRRLVVAGDRGEMLGIVTQSSLLRVLDPMEMSGIIDVLQKAVEQRTKELQKAIAQKEREMAIRERAEERLRLLESVVVNANDAIAIMDSGQNDPSDPRFVYVNEAFTQMTGYSLEEIAGQTPSCLRGPNSDPAQIAKIRTALSRREVLRLEIINYRKDGSEYWVELNSVPVTDDRGNLTHWISIQRNITDRKRMEQALFEEKELAQVTLQSIGDGVITTDASGRVQSLNLVAQKLTGWSLEEAKGLSLTKVFPIVHETTRTPVENTAETALREDRVVDMLNHSVLIARNGSEFAIDHTAAPIHEPEGGIIGAVLVFRDVTQVRTQARQLSWQATHDALTGLVNRREFEYRLEGAVFSSQSHNQQHILLYLDLDRFKIVNDTCGHVAGDEMLRQVTEQFKSRIRKSDTLARLGGDEFAVLLYQCPMSQGLQVAEALLQSIQAFRFVWQDKTFSIGVSIGLVAINAETQSASSVLSEADAACYAAKDKGRNRVHIYQVGDRDLARQRGQSQWVVRINQALEEDKFCLYCQSIVSLQNPSLNEGHCEVLLRLKGENGELISPMAFIPSAERYHLMHAIDRWVIRTLFKKINLGGQKQNTDLISGENLVFYPNQFYAVNLSGSSLNDDQFIDFIYEQFSLYKIPPRTICFEITETVAIANLNKVAGLIRTLKEFGCQFALDDFGSGMSSFAYLKNLPVDFLKIDGNFVKNIVENPIDRAMVEAINRIGHVMGLKTIAEFVENDAILIKLKEIGVDYAQGYGIDKPQPFQATIRANSQEVLEEVSRNELARS